MTLPAESLGLAVRRRQGTGARGIVLLHATGLCPSAYGPMMEAVDPAFTIEAPALRGHGASALPVPARLPSWQVFADDIVSWLASTDRPAEVVLAGHSMGAVVAMMAAAQLPKPPPALVMFDPVILPAPVRAAAHVPMLQDLLRRVPPASKVARRRADWPDLETVRKAYVRTPFFANWDAAAFDGYLAEGLRAQPDGGVSLACAPAFEASVFAAQAYRFWTTLATVRQRGTAVTVVRAARGSTVPDWALPRLRRAGVRIETATTGHLICLEAPAEAAVLLAEGARVRTV